MKKYFFIVLLFSFSAAKSQLLNIEFDKLLYDFGYIKESEGKVFCVFEVFNREKFPVEITEVATSCGCTVPFIEQKIIDPGKSCFIKIAYDPTGRPGRFMRSVEIKIRSSDNESKYFVNVKGVVIEKEVLKEYSEDGNKLNKLYIKPFRSNVISPSDLRFLSDPAFRDFINDITYEIDLYNFTTLKIELFSSLLDENNPIDEDLFPLIKKFILAEMEKRNYSVNQLSFSDNYVYDPMFSENEKATIKISSFYLNNDTISGSGFYKIKSDSLNTVNKTHQSIEKDTLHFQAKVAGIYRQSGKKINKNKEYRSFIENCTRAVLMDQKIFLGITLKGFSKEKEEELKRMKSEMEELVTQLQWDVLLSLEEEGISAMKAEFTVPLIQVSVSTTKKRSVPEFFITRYYPEIEKNKNLDSSLLFAHHKKSIYADESGIYKAPQQNLPVYFQFVSKGKNTIDTSTLDFKLWKKVMLAESQKEKKISFLIEAGSSNDVAFKNNEPGYVSRLRYKQTVETLERELKLNYKINFSEPVILKQQQFVYSDQNELLFNDEFDYVKIIPVFQADSAQTSSDDLVPYIIHFNYNDFTLPSSSEIFQSFVSRIIPVIDREGSIKLVIETSSTNVPVKGFSDNERLSQVKAEKTKDILLEEIKKRGYDPMRVIITEKRTLLQGPFYRPGYESSNVYENFQYIKIIPEQLIEK